MGNVRCNGKRVVTIKTIHGRFKFRLQQYQVNGEHQSYFDWTEQMDEGYVSVRLQEVGAYYSNRMSYEEVARSQNATTHPQ